MSENTFFPSLATTIKKFETEVDQISDDRRKVLGQLSDYIVDSKESHRKVQLLFVCTHNSRRSHIAQVWAHTYAQYFGISEVYCYSGGTEATAFNPNAIEALRRCGFEISGDAGYKANPRYHVKSGEGTEDIVCYSKRFDEPPNPEVNFAAVMVCSDADENCPFIPGVVKRISLTFDDPKNYDGTDQQDEMYDLACRMIGRELLLSFDLAAKKLKAV